MYDISYNLLLFLIFLLFLSAFFSSAETCFSSVNTLRLKRFSAENRTGGKKAYYISQNFDHALSTILIGNNLVNIAAASISASIATNLFGSGTGLLISTFVMTILILIFGEVLPKSFAKENAETHALRISAILVLLMKLFSPITWLLVKLKKFVSSFMKKKDYPPSITEQELKEMVSISEEEGVIDSTEKELVHNSFDFDDVLVGQIKIPRTDITAIDINLTITEIMRIVLTEKYSRLPVYEGTIDNIIGILSEKDFYRHFIRHKDVNLKELLQKPIFVIENTRISSLLLNLQKQRVHMAIVVDEFGGTSGLITLENIIEQLVGDIWDEHDEIINTMSQLDCHIFEFLGDISLEDFSRITKITLPVSTYQTLGGWLVETFEKIPEISEKIHYDHLEIEIIEADYRRIRKVKVTMILY